ncbi:hypothetical protein JTE90_015215 [Oedothorax gibbosus]|uniref:Uncharacterized protein n=1 Tax=Oedothorax gibbosus TaxID=931172 RepID=A0AAV6VAB5_9ARAC|nr:hypothetical protein JTE90_015215 [Oedothorax gibbosus]
MRKVLRREKRVQKRDETVNELKTFTLCSRSIGDIPDDSHSLRGVFHPASLAHTLSCFTTEMVSPLLLLQTLFPPHTVTTSCLLVRNAKADNDFL